MFKNDRDNKASRASLTIQTSNLGDESSELNKLSSSDRSQVSKSNLDKEMARLLSPSPNKESADRKPSLMVSSAVKSPAFTKIEPARKASILTCNTDDNNSPMSLLTNLQRGVVKISAEEEAAQERSRLANDARSKLLHRLRVEDMGWQLEGSARRNLFGSPLKGFQRLYKVDLDLRNCFNETELLSEGEQEVRRIARAHDLPLHVVENLKRQFDIYDTNENGEIELTKISNDEFIQHL